MKGGEGMTGGDALGVQDEGSEKTRKKPNESDQVSFLRPYSARRVLGGLHIAHSASLLCLNLRDKPSTREDVTALGRGFGV